MTVASNTVIGTLPGGTEVVAASLEAGRELLTTVDDYLSQQSPFDRQARVNLRRQVVEVTLPMYLDYIASQVMSWSQAEIKALGAIVSAMAKLFAPLSLPLPAEIHLVKTSGQEEGYAAYTRRKDTIVLPANMVASVETAASYGDPLHPTNDVSYLQNVMIHECFHLFSKNHPEERFKLYDRIHYRSTGAAVVLPDVPWGPPGSQTTMGDLKIMNPDEPDFDVYIEMLVPSIPGAEDSPRVKRALAPLLLAKSPYQGGVFFEYLEWWFMSIAEGPDRRWAPVLDPDGHPGCTRVRRSCPSTSRSSLPISRRRSFSPTRSLRRTLCSWRTSRASTSLVSCTRRFRPIAGRHEPRTNEHPRGQRGAPQREFTPRVRWEPRYRTAGRADVRYASVHA
ncbi:MAG: hypothetical protein MK210_12230 [Dehalococcoidia bacterium]|nr:hypothetical protein [Dehalococcoidia bacterium]